MMHRRTLFANGWLAVSIGLWLLCACSGAHDETWSVIVATRTVATLGEPPSDSPHLLERELTRLESGDFIHPRFSPSANLLAFAEVVVKDEVELDGVSVLDVATHEVRALMKPEESRKYAAYAASVYDLTWLDESHIEVAISDGDVAGHLLRYDVQTGTLLNTEYLDEEDGPAPLEQPFVDLISSCGQAFPDLSAEELESTFHQRPVVIGEKRVVVQLTHVGEGDGIWLLDCGAGVKSLLLQMGPAEKLYALRGGLAIKDSVALLVHLRSGLSLMSYSDGRLRTLAELAPDAERQDLKVKHRTDDHVYFEVYLHRPSEPGDNPVFTFDGENLVRFVDFPVVHDVEISGDRALVAFSIWNEGKRILVIGKANL